MKGIQAFCTLQLFCKATTDKIKSLSKRLLQPMGPSETNTLHGLRGMMAERTLSAAAPLGLRPLVGGPWAGYLKSPQAWASSALRQGSSHSMGSFWPGAWTL